MAMGRISVNGRKRTIVELRLPVYHEPGLLTIMGQIDWDGARVVESWESIGLHPVINFFVGWVESSQILTGDDLLRLYITTPKEQLYTFNIVKMR